MPSYLHNLVSDRCTSSSLSLRSSRQPLLAIHQCKTAYGRHAFSVAAAENWNKLPIDVQLSDTSTFFLNRLKTFLFYTAFNDINNFIKTIELSASVAWRFMALYKYELNWMFRTGLEASPNERSISGSISIAGKSAEKSNKNNRRVCRKIIQRQTWNCRFNYTWKQKTRADFI